MATALRTNINANTVGGLAHGYSASGAGSTVIITAPAGSGVGANGLALTFNQTGLTAVTGPSLSGGAAPTAPTTTSQLTITALGDKRVLNHAYSGPSRVFACSLTCNQKFITRHYGFGSAAGTVTIGGVAAPVVGAWTDGLITVTVPAGVPACAVQQRNVARHGAVRPAGDHRCQRQEVDRHGHRDDRRQGTDLRINCSPSITSARPTSQPAAARDRRRRPWRPDHRRPGQLQGNAADVEAGPAAGRRRGIRHASTRTHIRRASWMPGAGSWFACSACRWTGGPQQRHPSIRRVPCRVCCARSTGFPSNPSRLGCHRQRQPGADAAGAHADGRVRRRRASRCSAKARTSRSIQAIQPHISGCVKAAFPAGTQYLTSSDANCNATSCYQLPVQSVAHRRHQRDQQFPGRRRDFRAWLGP